MHLGSASKHRASSRCGWRAKEREEAAREQERGRSAGGLRRKRGALEGGRFKSSELFWSSSECKKEMGGPREGDEEIKRTKRGKPASAPKKKHHGQVGATSSSTRLPPPCGGGIMIKLALLFWRPAQTSQKVLGIERATRTEHCVLSSFALKNLRRQCSCAHPDELFDVTRDLLLGARVEGGAHRILV